MTERKRKGLLSLNPDPIRLVDKAVRDVWTKQPGWRCYHEDGRGRCTSRETKSVKAYAPDLGRSYHEWYCERHMP